MCGRYAIYSRFAKLGQQLQLDLDLPARYNIAPGQPVPIIRHVEEDGHEVVDAHWGLIPFWSKDRKIAYSTFNARAETVAEKPAFRAAFRHRRCIIPASGLYEWQNKEMARKQPWHIAAADGDGLGLAGLWERWSDPDSGETIDSCAIIVGPANTLTHPIHERLACILPAEHYRHWLAPDAPAPFLHSLLTPCPVGSLRLWRVSPAIGNVRNQGAELIAPIEDLAPPLY